jgi:hypothetical protein
MSFTDSQSTFGAWTLKLRSQVERDEQGNLLPAAPQSILDLFSVKDGPDAFLGHIIITSQRFDPDEVDVLELARYTGVLRASKFDQTSVELSGAGLIYWLGDLQERGPMFTTELNLSSASFTDGITAILPPAITAGTIVPEVGSASASYLFVTARAALEDWLSLFNAEYYVTPQGELNAGTPASLFPSYNNPTTFIIRKGAGADPTYKPLPLASASFNGDMTNFATKVISLVQVEDTNFLEAEEELDPPTSKRDLHGNLVDIVDVNNESTTLAANVAARAAARLAQIGVARTSVELSTENYDIHGDFKPGDSVWVYDVPSGLYDLTNKIEFNGQTYYPVKLRVQEITAPIPKGSGVYFRTPNMAATIYDLSDYFIPEPAGTSQIVVSEFSRSLIPPSSGGIGGIIAPVINPGAPPGIPDPPTVFGDERTLFVVVPTTTGGDPQPINVTTMRVYASTVSGFTPGPTNYIGAIPVSRANILLGQTVKGAFEWFTDELTYVRVTAVNAQEGPASLEVSDAATLIPSAAILSLVADKIDAGTISASISIISPTITGGTLQTAASGQRVALEEGEPDRVNYYTGDISESDPAVMQSSVVGAGATRQLTAVVASPRFTGYAGFANAVLASRGQGGSPETRAELNTINSSGNTSASIRVGEDNVSAWVGATTDRRWLVTSSEVSLSFGNSTSQPVVILDSTSAEMRRGSPHRFVRVDTDAASIGYAPTGRRLRIEATKATIAASDNTDRFDVRDDRISLYTHTYLTDWDLRFRAATDGNHYWRYNAAIDGIEGKGAIRFWLRAGSADVSIYADGGKLHIMDYAGTGNVPVVANGFEHSSPPTVSGSRAGNAALDSLLIELDAMGLINDTTSP